MDAQQVIGLYGAAIGGSLIGIAGCYLQMSRTMAVLRSRLDRSEQARAGAVERSTQAREQISQLNKSITELRQTHSVRDVQQRKREEMKRLLEEAEPATLALPRREPLQVFADTEPMI